MIHSYLVCGKHVNKYKICSLIHSYIYSSCRGAVGILGATTHRLGATTQRRQSGTLGISSLVSLTVLQFAILISQFFAGHPGNAYMIYEVSCNTRFSRSFPLTGIKKAVLLKQIQPAVPT